jgi:predicted dithiol-disulfide oxidoreductase (DUF899 family)
VSLPKVVTHDEWLAARKELLAKEKELTLGGRLPELQRRRGRGLEGADRAPERAPIDKLERYKAKKGWTIPWYSSYATDFNYDLRVTLDESVMPAEYNYRRQAVEGEQPMELPGLSCFLRVDERVFHTYSTYARGAEMLGGSYYWLDLTALGRGEDWEEPKDRATSVRAAVPDFHNRDYHGESVWESQRPMLNVFHRDGDAIRHFWASELLYAPTDPDQDPRHVGVIEPLWNLFDFTREGRPTDWEEQLAYS